LNQSEVIYNNKSGLGLGAVKVADI